MIGRTALLIGASLIGMATLKKETKDHIRSKISSKLIGVAIAIKPKAEVIPDQNDKFIRTLFQLN
jgi:hypothetical protein